MGAEPEALRIMLGFVVRRCAVALGHTPTATELAQWANNQRDARGRYRIFGRAITAEQARVILEHPGRLVTVRGETLVSGRGALASPARPGDDRRTT